MNTLRSSPDRVGEGLQVEYVVEIVRGSHLTSVQLDELGDMLRVHAVRKQLAELRARVAELLTEQIEMS